MGFDTRSGGKDAVYGFSIDRSYVNQCLSKAIAYKQCGKDDEAARWARLLINELELNEILDTH